MSINNLNVSVGSGIQISDLVVVAIAISIGMRLEGLFSSWNLGLVSCLVDLSNLLRLQSVGLVDSSSWSVRTSDCSIIVYSSISVLSRLFSPDISKAVSLISISWMEGRLLSRVVVDCVRIDSGKVSSSSIVILFKRSFGIYSVSVDVITVSFSVRASYSVLGCSSIFMSGEVRASKCRVNIVVVLDALHKLWHNIVSDWAVACRPIVSS